MLEMQLNILELISFIHIFMTDLVHKHNNNKNIRLITKLSDLKQCRCEWKLVLDYNIRWYNTMSDYVDE